MDFKNLSSVLSRFKEQNILVIGDLMIDEYLWGKIERISPEAPVQVVDVEKEEYTLGGAGNVVKNLVSLGSRVDIASVIAGGGNGNLIVTELEELGVPLDGLFKDSNRTSSKKTRIMSSTNNQQILRVDRETRRPISKANEDGIISFVRDNVDEFSAVILSDYAKGVLTQRVLQSVIRLAREHSVAAIVDPKGDSYEKYRGATIIAPNKREAGLALGIAITGEKDLRKARRKLLDKLATKAVLITQGAKGMTLFESGKEAVHIPTRAREVYDVTGAGDTVVSVLALGIASGLSFGDAAQIANIAAGIVVSKLGSATVTAREMLESVERRERNLDGKINEREQLKNLINREQAGGKKIVFTNGCFDLLHVGHVKLLQEAKSLGDILVVGLNSDDSVRRVKSKNRPLVAEQERAYVLAALDSVDYVTLFDEDTPLELIKALRPDVLVKGKDYQKSEVVGREIVESYGGRVELLDLVKDISTTSMINRIAKAHDTT